MLVISRSLVFVIFYSLDFLAALLWLLISYRRVHWSAKLHSHRLFTPNTLNMVLYVYILFLLDTSLLHGSELSKLIVALTVFILY